MSAGGDSELQAAEPHGQGQRPTVADHPRASRHVRLAKGWGGLIGFVLVAVLSWRAGRGAFDVGLRALAAGLVGFIVAWAVTLSAWRLLVEAEPRLAVAEAREAAEALSGRRLERAIVVVYRAETERQSHYFHARLSRQFDAVLHFDETSAVEALEPPEEQEAAEEELPETFPSAL